MGNPEILSPRAFVLKTRFKGYFAAASIVPETTTTEPELHRLRKTLVLYQGTTFSRPVND